MRSDLERAASRYLDSNEVRALAQCSIKNYKAIINKILTWCKKHEINTPDELRNNVQLLCAGINKDMSDGSVRQYLTVLKFVYKYNNLAPIAYTHHIPKKEKRDKLLKHLQRWFSEAEVEKMLAYDFSKRVDAKNRGRLLVRLLFETGARVGEISSVKTEDFHIDDNTFFITTSKTVPRVAFFSNKTRMIIDKMQIDYEWRDPIFKNTSYCQTLFDYMLTDLGLKSDNDGRGPHTARHYVATYLKYVANMDINDIAYLLGDAPDTIVNTYLHPTPSMLKGKVFRAFGWWNNQQKPIWETVVDIGKSVPKEKWDLVKIPE
jgi:integrase